MKNVKFLFGLFFGVIISAVIFYFVSCKSEPVVTNTQTSKAPTTSVIEEIDGYLKVYKLDVDNIRYLVVVNGRHGGTAIIKHQ
jgi:hypothetical protein